MPLFGTCLSGQAPAMWKILNTFVLACTISVNGSMTRFWDYTVISSYANTSNENMLQAEMKAVRVGRGEYAVSGTFNLSIIIPNEYTVMMETFYSKSGVGEFTKLPVTVPRQNFNDYMGLTYKEFIMKSVKNCSNLPQFEGQWKGPLLPENFWFDKCLVDQSHLFIYVRSGYAKLRFFGDGGGNSFFAETLIKIEPWIV